MAPAKRDPDARDRIVRHARALLFSTGLTGTTMEKIALDLQISKKTLYKHFPDRGAIVRACMEEFMLETQAMVRDVTADPEDLIANMVGLLNLISSRVVLLGREALSDIARWAPDTMARIDRFRAEKINSLFSTLHRRGVDEGWFIDRPADELAEIMITVTHAVVSPEFVLRTGIPLGHAVPLLLETMFSGMLTARGRRRFEALKKNLGRNLP